MEEKEFSPVTENQFKRLKKRFAREKLWSCEIVTDSMEPVIRVGERIIVVQLDQELRLFDIIVFHQTGKLVCHIFVKKSQLTGKNGKDIFLTSAYKGKGFDHPINSSEILGKVVSHRLSLIQKIKFLWKLSKKTSV